MLYYTHNGRGEKILQNCLFFFKYFTMHSTSFSCFGDSMVLLFSLYYFLLIIFGFFSVSDNVSVPFLVRFIYTFSVGHTFFNFSAIAATVAGSCGKYGGACECFFVFPCQGSENCLFSSCGVTLYTAK